MPEQHPQTPKLKTSQTSPKRFFRAFNSSPFRASNSSQSRDKKPEFPDPSSPDPVPFDFHRQGSPSLSPSFRIHARSQSHDLAQRNGRKQGTTNWTQLIPPLPTSPSGSSRSSSSSNVNRHTIAVSPDAMASIPDMLQPSTNAELERSLVLEKQPNQPNQPKHPGWVSPFVSSGVENRTFALKQAHSSRTSLNVDSKSSLNSQQKPPPKPFSSANSSSSLVSAEKLAAFSRSQTEPYARGTSTAGNPSHATNAPHSTNALYSKEASFPTNIPHSSNASHSRNISQGSLPPQTPPPKLAHFSQTPPSHQRGDSLHHRNDSWGHLPRQKRPEMAASKSSGTIQSPMRPPLISQHSSRAVTVSQTSDSGSPYGLGDSVSGSKTELQSVAGVRGIQASAQNQNMGLNTQQQQQRQQQQQQSSHLSQSQHSSNPLEPQHNQRSQQQVQQNSQHQQQQQKQRRPSEKKRKSCSSCHQIINGQFVRALNNAYHIECFKCHECGVLCSAKFFPHEITNDEGVALQVPLCEYDYFKKLSLICHTCDSALRGPYITALGNKYHLEHFKCHACGKVFESDESYYEHDNSVYCHFHYSRLFATKCEGCHSSIVKQFVELFKSGKVQQWHPECYMVFKFWNVSVTMESVGVPEPQGPTNSELTARELAALESKVEAAVMNCWVVLSGFEETSASCISEMLLSACSGKRSTGMLTTGRLVLYLEILFRALDYVQNMCMDHKPDNVSVSDSKRAFLEEVYSVDAFDKFQALRKEPRNISGKLMSYLAILRKSHQIAESGSLSSDLLAVITGCAHYLKLLIRIGLNNALALNKLRGDTRALDGFLASVKTYEDIELSIGEEDKRNSCTARLSVPYNSTDACRSCSKSIEKACIKFGDRRWHVKCFECNECHRKPSSEFRVESFLLGSNDMISCSDCAMSDKVSGMGYTSGFVRVSDLSQLIYLLKIALSRSRNAIKKDSAATGSVDYLKPTSNMSHIAEEPSETETTYSKTLDEVTSLRQMRESQKLGTSVKKKARKSVIVEAPEAATAKADNTANEMEERRVVDRKGSSSSSVSFTTSRRDSDCFDFRTNPIKIRDEPSRMASNSLGRTSDLLKNEKSLTLDDIPRIVAAEQAREQRPNAFKHHNSLYQKKNPQINSGSNNVSPHEPAQPYFSDDNREDEEHKYFSELTKQEHTILRHIAVEALLSVSNQFSRDELLAILQSKKPTTFWDKFRIGGGDKKTLNVFGSDLKDVAKKYGVDTSLGVGPSQLRIPVLMEDIILALRQKDVSVEGIFRLNGNIKNLRELTEQINAAPLKSPNYGNYSAVQLAALMKKWLRELPDPLLTFSLYDVWISSRRTENPAKAKRVLQLSYCLLPRSHRNLLEVLLYFFSWVASFAEIDEETGSKMDTHNLATVLAPNILFSKAASGENGENQSSDAHFLAIEVVNQLIEVHEDLALIPNDVWEFYNKCEFGPLAKADNITAKEIQTKISKVRKETPDFFSDYARKDSYAEPSHHNTIKRGHATLHVMEK